MLVLSPTPPVECLPTFGNGEPERSSITPEESIASVQHPSSTSSIPWNNTAIRKEDI